MSTSSPHNDMKKKGMSESSKSTGENGTEFSLRFLGGSMGDEELLTPEDVAKMLKVEKRFILALVKKGELPAHRLGNKTIRFIKSEIIEAMKNRG